MNITTLKEMKFNTTQAESKINKSFAKLEKDITSINKIAEAKKIYIKVDEQREKEKILMGLYPFIRLGYQSSLRYSSVSEILKEIENKFYSRFKNALQDIGFKSINEKTKTIKCSKKYNFLGLDLYPLNLVAEFPEELKSMDDTQINVLKTHKNLNVEFSFKTELEWNIFKEIVFHNTELTQRIINTSPNDTIEAYKEAYKTKHLNECSIIYQAFENESFIDRNAINYNLINKAWGLI